MNEADLRAQIVRLSASLFQRGLTPGSSGNISVRLDDGFLATPTNSCLGFLEADKISRLDAQGKHISGDPPTKEMPLHQAFYRAQPPLRAVVHLHSTYATLLSCLANTDPENAIAPITPYVVMRVGRVPLVAYARPGSQAMGDLAAEKARHHRAILLANHGPVVAAESLEAAVFAMEELEETAKLLVLGRALPLRLLDGKQIAELETAFKR